MIRTERKKNYFYPTLAFSAIFLAILISSCIEPSAHQTPSPQSSETAEVITQESKEPEKKKEKVPEKTPKKVLDPAIKKQQELKKKQAQINAIKQKLATLGYNRVNDPEKLKAASDCLKIINESNLSYNATSQAILLVKKAEILHNLGKSTEAHAVLTKNWKKILLPDPEMKGKGQINSAPSAEAYFLKGNIELAIAKSAKNSQKAETFGKKAVKSYYAVLNLYDPNRCIYTAQSVKGFQAGRKFLAQRFKIKVGFPPEF